MMKRISSSFFKTKSKTMKLGRSPGISKSYEQ